METDYKSKVTMDPSGFVLLADYVPSIVQEIRYYSTYNFIGDKIDGYEQPCAIITKEAARALKTVSNEFNVQGYRMKVFDCYRPQCAVKHFVMWGIEDNDIRMKDYFYPDLVKQELFSKGYVASKSSHSRGSTIDLTLILRSKKCNSLLLYFFKQISSTTTCSIFKTSLIFKNS